MEVFHCIDGENDSFLSCLNKIITNNITDIIQ